MRSAVGFQLFVLLLAACVFAEAASMPSDASDDVRSDGESSSAEAQGRKHGEQRACTGTLHSWALS
jgi:hypothetical protein